MRLCTVEVTDKFGQLHTQTVEASSLFDAYLKAMVGSREQRAWVVESWWPQGGPHTFTVRSGEQSWQVNERSVNPWADETPRVSLTKPIRREIAIRNVLVKFRPMCFQRFTGHTGASKGIIRACPARFWARIWARNLEADFF